MPFCAGRSSNGPLHPMRDRFNSVGIETLQLGLK
jgi:hypothetical protein